MARPAPRGEPADDSVIGLGVGSGSDLDSDSWGLDVDVRVREIQSLMIPYSLVRLDHLGRRVRTANNRLLILNHSGTCRNKRETYVKREEAMDDLSFHWS